MDEKKGFSILAVIAGGLVIYLGKFLMGMISNALLFGIGPLAAFTSRSHSTAAPHTPLPSMAIAAMVSWVIALVIGAFISLAGGALAGSLAPAAKAEHGLLAGVIAVTVSVLMTLRHMSAYQQALSSGANMLMIFGPMIFSLLLTLIFAWLGGRMVSGKGLRHE